MNLFVRKASTYSEEEKAYLSITGIPDNWPIETIPNAEGTPPENYILMSEEDLATLFLDNQSAYAVWAITKEQGTPLQENYKVESYENNCIKYTKWYQNKEGDTFTNLARQMTYFYDGTDLLQVDVETFDSKGVVTRKTETKYFTDTDTNEIFTETEVL